MFEGPQLFLKYLLFALDRLPPVGVPYWTIDARTRFDLRQG